GTGAGMSGGGSCGGGGGGHGGAGGRSNCANIVGGVAYGDADQPVTFGSGGGGYPGVTSGGIGGGVVRLDIAGSLILDGAITASGVAPINSSGGAGGSVWVRATSISGVGTMRATGATERTTNGSSGGGGGGRIAVEACNIASTIALVATGGTANPGALEGAPGSVVVRTASGCTPTCDDIDFNNNDVFPEDQDVIDFFNVLAGADCPACNDIDFNNNTVFPEDQDVIDFFNVLAGGECS
ncbi:MAG TPA: hypothetical protein VK157_17885, partial [Phycisphaerales bacterium]|nr:hypothetical protein [Phycisphaerales bacterium]